MGINEMLLAEAKKMVNAMPPPAGALDTVSKPVQSDEAADDALPYEIAEIVKVHARGAAAAALASGWVPGAGGVAATVAAAGFIWSMYGRIGARIGVPFGKNVLRSVASGVATNLAASFAGGIAISTAFSILPGIGSVGAAAITGATVYALTFASGYVYIKILTELFESRADLSTVSEQDLKGMAAAAAKKGDVRDMVKAAKAEFRAKQKQGEFDRPIADITYPGEERES